MTRTDIARAPELGGLALRRDHGLRFGAPVWMAAAFFVSLILALGVLARYGTGEDATALALRITARWCFLLFWPAYAGGALAKLFGPRFAALARRGREFGLAFAAALAVHLGLVLWLIAVETRPNGLMIFFWIGAFCAFLLALLSVPPMREAFGTRLWRLVCTVAMEYIALVFAADFIAEPLRGGGLGTYPPTYLPFALVLIGGAALRLAAYGRRPRPAPQAPA